jgi:hypothetical protein
MTGPAIYQAGDTGQMRLVTAKATSGSLELHELRDDGLPLCGPKPESWQGKQMQLVSLGAGPVTCQLCARITAH